MFRTRRPRSVAHTVPAAPQPQEPLAITLGQEELEALERLFAREKAVLLREQWSYYGPVRDTGGDDLLCALYQRAGAASVTGATGVPLLVTEIPTVEGAVRTLEQYRTSSQPAIAEGRTLLRSLHFLAGRATAIRELGGTPALPAGDEDR